MKIKGLAKHLIVSVTDFIYKLLEQVSEIEIFAHVTFVVRGYLIL